MDDRTREVLLRLVEEERGRAGDAGGGASIEYELHEEGDGEVTIVEVKHLADGSTTRTDLGCARRRPCGGYETDWFD